MNDFEEPGTLHELPPELRRQISAAEEARRRKNRIDISIIAVWALLVLLIALGAVLSNLRRP